MIKTRALRRLAPRCVAAATAVLVVTALLAWGGARKRLGIITGGALDNGSLRLLSGRHRGTGDGIRSRSSAIHDQRRRRRLPVVTMREMEAGDGSRSGDPKKPLGFGDLVGYLEQGGSIGAVKGDGPLIAKAQENTPEQRCFVFKGEKKARCQANIFFFGVSKCGTTSLAHWMAYHPSLRWVGRMDSPGLKPGAEAHVMEALSYNHGRSYALTAPKAAETDPVIEYTPHYSILAYVPYMIMEMHGNMARDGTIKYIAILREPASRAISSWQFKYDLHGIENGEPEGPGSERRSLEKVYYEGRKRVRALVECRSDMERLLKADFHSVPTLMLMVDLDKCNPRRFMEENEYFAHVGKSVYFLQLERWIELFGRENVKVLFLEEMADDPLGTLSSVFDFLGMDLIDAERGKTGLRTRKEWEKIVLRRHNLTDERKKRILDEQVTPQILRSMRDFFAPYNTQLEKLLGRPLPGNWSTAATD